MSDKESIQYGEMLGEVEAITRAVDAEDLELDELVSKVERGYELIKKMRSRLDVTKEKIESLRDEFERDED